jgi:hypothetical protein
MIEQRRSSSQFGGANSVMHFAFPWSHYTPLPGSNMPLLEFKHISETTYGSIYQSFRETCVSSSQYLPFRTDVFPAPENIGFFVDLYIRHFQPVLPLIHTATFDPSTCHWLLVLAMASIGSQYAEVQGSDLLTRSIHEFLRRALQTVVSFLMQPVPLARLTGSCDIVRIREYYNNE